VPEKKIRSKRISDLEAGKLDKTRHQRFFEFTPD